MKARIIISPDGTLQAYIDEGSYEEGKAKLEMLIVELNGLGIRFAEIGEVEQHRHDQEHSHIHAANENH